MVRPLKVAFVAPFPPPYGGMGVRFERLTELLCQRGHRCTKIPILWPDGPRWARRVRRLLSFLACAFQVFRSDAPLVHCVTGSIKNFCALSLVLLSARFSRKGAVLSIAGGDWSAGVDDLPQITKWILRSLLSLAHRTIVCNLQIEHAVLGLGLDSARIVRISNALPDELGQRHCEPVPSEFTDFAKFHKPLLLYVGAMQQQYGLADVVLALEKLHRGNPSVGLVVFIKKGGDKRFSSKIASLIDLKGLSDTIVMFESVPWVVSAMKSADLMIRANRRQEGDSRAVREALAVGLPVVATDVGIRPAGVTHYSAGDFDGLVDTVGAVLKVAGPTSAYVDPEGDKNIQKYESVYGELLQAGRNNLGGQSINL